MKKVLARVHIGGNNFKTRDITVYTREEAKRILSNKNWNISDGAYDIKNRNVKIANGFEWEENGVVVGIYTE